MAGAYLGIKARALTLLYTGAAVEVGAAMTVAAQLAATDAASCHTVSQRIMHHYGNSQAAIIILLKDTRLRTDVTHLSRCDRARTPLAVTEHAHLSL